MNELDSRYTIELEHVGFKAPRYVGRFCGDYLGQNIVKAHAVEICKEHNKRRFRK